MTTSRQSGIYAIHNTVNDIYYIGGTHELDRRWSAHRSLLRTGKHPNSLLRADWTMHGESAFAFSVLEEIPNPAILFQREKAYIAMYVAEGKRLYNGMPENGSNGGGPLPRRVELSEKAARYIRERATITGTRFRTEEASATNNAILEALADGTLVHLLMTDELRTVIPYIEHARQQCFSEAAQRGLDQLLAALWVASNNKQEGHHERPANTP